LWDAHALKARYDYRAEYPQEGQAVVVYFRPTELHARIVQQPIDT
jgi:hypothetical protein